MRRFLIPAAMVAASMLIIPVVAEDGPGPISRVALWEIDASAEGSFEEDLAKHNAFHKKQGDDQAHHTWEILSGPNTGKFYRVAPRRHWSDFDREDVWAEADVADAAKTVTPHIASAPTAFYFLMRDVSRPKSASPASMASLIWFKVRIGHTGKFEHLIKKFHAAIDETDWPAHYLWLQMINGREGPLYVLILRRDNWADFAPQEKSFAAVLEEAYGETEAEGLLEEWSKSLKSMRSEIVRFRTDLSYIPEGS